MLLTISAAAALSPRAAATAKIVAHSISTAMAPALLHLSMTSGPSR